MEIVASSPTLLLDGAHSPPKMAALAEGLRSLFPGRRVIGVLAFSQGHDASATLSKLGFLLHTAILTGFNAATDYGSRYALPAGDLAATIASSFPLVECCIETDPYLAIEMARRMAGPQDLICVTGSIFLVGQVRPALIGYKK
jgi:dihydrofolate synthase/folylpolyglutamate synthase